MWCHPRYTTSRRRIFYVQGVKAHVPCSTVKSRINRGGVRVASTYGSSGSTTHASHSRKHPEAHRSRRLRRVALWRRALSRPRRRPDRGQPSREEPHDRKESERFKSFTYEDLIKRDKISLAILTPRIPARRPRPQSRSSLQRIQVWLKDELPEGTANHPPEMIAAEIVEDLEAALQQFAAIAQDLKK